MRQPTASHNTRLRFSPEKKKNCSTRSSLIAFRRPGVTNCKLMIPLPSLYNSSARPGCIPGVKCTLSFSVQSPGTCLSAAIMTEQKNFRAQPNGCEFCLRALSCARATGKRFACWLWKTDCLQASCWWRWYEA